MRNIFLSYFAHYCVIIELNLLMSVKAIDASHVTVGARGFDQDVGQWFVGYGLPEILKFNFSFSDFQLIEHGLEFR